MIRRRSAGPLVACRAAADGGASRGRLLQLEKKMVTPPHKPHVETERDLANFPPEFTDEPVQLTPDDQ